MRESAEKAKMITLASQQKAESTEALLSGLTQLKEAVSALRSSAEKMTAPAVTQLEAELKTLSHFTYAQTLSLSSMIISDFPEIFSEFRGRWFSLLWRARRDGFGGRDFHSRCDGHPNTMTVILDTEGHIFGGFTPVV
jgi:hypothetical protein